MIGVPTAIRTGECGGTAARDDREFVFFRGDAGDGERRRRVRHVEREFGAAVERFAGLRGRLRAVVAMVDRLDLDLPAEDASAEIVDGHLRRRNGASTGERRVDAGHIGDDGDLDRTVIRGDRCEDGLRRDESTDDGEGRRNTRELHDTLISFSAAENRARTARGDGCSGSIPPPARDSRDPRVRTKRI
jgi:hypothetical protein